MKRWFDHSSVQSRRKNAVVWTLMLLAGGLLYGLLAMSGIFSFPCPLKLITGLDCPACGITRAALAVLRLDFQAAFSLNMLWLPIFLYLAWLYGWSVHCYIKKGNFNYSPPFWALDIAFGIVMVVWCVVRNILFFNADGTFYDSLIMTAWRMITQGGIV